MGEMLTTVLGSVRAYGKRAGPVLPNIPEMLSASLILAEDWEMLPAEIRGKLLCQPEPAEVLPELVERGLLTDYQAGRIEAGTAFGLILGNYRVLDRLGAGGMGVVFRAEHIRMRKQVAIKVLPFSPERDERILRRFFCEIRAIAQLNHPNIVGAIDAGEAEAPDGQGNVLQGRTWSK